MSNVHKDFLDGINKILGKESYGKPEKIRECTMHSSDGHIYDDEPNPVETTLCCSVCGQHYTVPSNMVNLDMIK